MSFPDDTQPDEASSVPEEVHIYSEGSSVPIAMPAELDWIELETEEAARYIDLRLIKGDLDFAIGILERLLGESNLPSDVVRLRDAERDDFRARWNAALIAYARVFGGGVRWPLQADALFDRDVPIHEFFTRIRNRHVAHSVSDFEMGRVFAGVTREVEPTFAGLLDIAETEQAPSRSTMEDLLRLARIADAYVARHLGVERERLQTFVRSNLAAVLGGGRVTHHATPLFSSSVPPRRSVRSNRERRPASG
jgi:hypothetical protein